MNTDIQVAAKIVIFVNFFPTSVHVSSGPGDHNLIDVYNLTPEAKSSDLVCVSIICHKDCYA